MLTYEIMHPTIQRQVGVILAKNTSTRSNGWLNLGEDEVESKVYIRYMGENTKKQTKQSSVPS
jgi:hypothetical protein